MKGWVILLAAFALYFISIFGGFVQDDNKVIVGDPEMGTVRALASTWTRPYYWREVEKSVYRPVTSFSFYLNSLITGKEAWGFRLGNVLIYVFMCWLVFEVMTKITDKKRAFWGALIFAVLPIHAEVVNNIVGRAEMLSLGFLLLAVLKNFGGKWDLSALFLVLAMLSKETAVVGIPILLYLIWTRKGKERWPASIFVMMALIGFVALRVVVLGGLGFGNNATMVENPLKFVEADTRIRTAIGLIPVGIGKIIAPVNLSYDYSFNQIKPVESWGDWRVVVGFLMIVSSVGSLLFESLRKNRFWIVGMMMFWGPVLITGNLLFPIGTIFGERLWFLPSLGVVMIAICWFEVRKRRSRPSVPRVQVRIRSVRHFACPSVPTILAIVVVTIFAGRTWVRNLDWLSQERLFFHDAIYAKDSVLAQNNKAAMHLKKRELEKAKMTMEIADRIYPKYPELLNNWGLYFAWTGNKEEAKKKFEECLVERPGNELCQGNLKILK